MDEVTIEQIKSIVLVSHPFVVTRHTTAESITLCSLVFSFCAVDSVPMP